jgi:hypothetical protein
MAAAIEREVVCAETVEQLVVDCEVETERWHSLDAQAARKEEQAARNAEQERAAEERRRAEAERLLQLEQEKAEAEEQARRLVCAPPHASYHRMLQAEAAAAERHRLEEEDRLAREQAEALRNSEQCLAVFVMGPPVCGGSMQARRLAEEWNLAHLDLEELFAAEMDADTADGRDLVWMAHTTRQHSRSRSS